MKFRFASFNVENLFDRPKLFMEDDFSKGDEAMANIQKLQRLVKKSTYSKQDKREMINLYGQVKNYVEIVESHGKLMNREKSQVTAKGSASWFGFLRLKRENFNDKTVKNTAQVIKNVNPDIACLVEVENRPVLDRFCNERLQWQKNYQQQKYPQNMLIDGNDNRGIDVGLISKYPIRRVRSHIDDRTKNGKEIFSRDCPEMEVLLPDGRSLWVLLNHLKSKGYGKTSVSNTKRKRQASTIADILKGYDLKKDLVVVAGDLNDTPKSAPLKPLMAVRFLHDVLTINPPADRWTYHYNQNQQIDYVLVSDPMNDSLKQSGVYRRGMHKVKTYSTTGETPLPTVTGKADSASDHGCVWADFEF